MKRLAVILTFIFLLNGFADLDVANTSSHKKMSETCSTASLDMTSNCGNAQSNSHPQIPFDCHECIGHCPSSHLVSLIRFENNNISTIGLDLEVSHPPHLNQYYSTNLNIDLRPPIAS